MPPITDVLVPNRGEIAIRIFRACTELGLRTTAIYSWEDRLSIHRYKADRAYLVGERGRPVDAYLDGDAIVALALRKGIDAVHPGYGFLSENADFAQKCLDAGITWIGPPPAVMRALGDKVRAREVARRAGVPVIGGTDAIESVDDIREFAAKHGFPILIKAAHGGGGRGMRVVSDDAEIDEAFDQARREAMSAFGSADVFVERFLRQPRHIEVQLVCDHHGNRVHFFERDCSIQRRHQKVVELAPAPNLTNEVRRKLWDYSLALANQVDYASVGTAEFLLEERDGQTEIYFIEVNTRIQVEHPVTELITGIDLIKTQIRVAAGEPLPFYQKGVRFSGHAIECRINAEDPDENFRPCAGTITRFRPPGGLGVRVDSYAHDGCRVSPHYDSLIAKVIVHQPTREEAIRCMQRCLAEFIIEPLKTTIPFQRQVLSHPDFERGSIDTGFVERVFTPSR